LAIKTGDVNSSDEDSCFGDNDSGCSDIESNEEENNMKDEDKFLTLLDKPQRRTMKNLIMSDYLYYEMDWLESSSLNRFESRHVVRADYLYRSWCSKKQINEPYPLNISVLEFIGALRLGENPYAISSFHKFQQHYLSL
jgi:hypothetical protein